MPKRFEWRVHWATTLEDCASDWTPYKGSADDRPAIERDLSSGVFLDAGFHVALEAAAEEAGFSWAIEVREVSGE